jgi:hypothetical protein
VTTFRFGLASVLPLQLCTRVANQETDVSTAHARLGGWGGDFNARSGSTSAVEIGEELRIGDGNRD